MTGMYDQSHVGRGQLIADPLGGSTAIGTLFGHRLWQVDDDGWLTGTYCKAKWLPGENTARCYQTRKPGTHPYAAFGYSPPAYDFDPVEPVVRDGWEPAPCPGVAAGDHGCGFYVRTGQRYTAGHYAIVRGVVEAWGQVEFGDQGFRATKARIVALLRPRVSFKHKTENFLRRRAIKILEASVEQMRQRALDPKEILVLNATEEQIETSRRILARHERPTLQWPNIVARYPDAEVFVDEAQMLKAWPATDLTSLLEEK